MAGCLPDTGGLVGWLIVCLARQLSLAQYMPVARAALISDFAIRWIGPCVDCRSVGVPSH